jgi:hypothetical protein
MNGRFEFSPGGPGLSERDRWRRLRVVMALVLSGVLTADVVAAVALAGTADQQRLRINAASPALPTPSESCGREHTADTTCPTPQPTAAATPLRHLRHTPPQRLRSHAPVPSKHPLPRPVVGRGWPYPSPPRPAPGKATITASRTSTPTAKDVYITVRVNYRTDPVITLYTGDGGRPEARCSDTKRYLNVVYRERSSTITTAVFRWSYRQHGHYQLTAKALTSCTGPWSVLTNGPHQPDAVIGSLTWTDDKTTHDPYLYTLNSDEFDLDGWLRTFTINWGDGSVPDKDSATLQDCQDPVTQWIFGGYTGGGLHHFPGPGIYTVTVQVFSEDCSGNAVQTKTESKVFRVTAGS